MSELELTGERYMPSQKGIIRYEHLHRYLLCLDLLKGKSVVDIACGEGYGSYILSGAATSVIGIDIDPKCINHAKKKHNKDNLQFLLGSCDKIPVNPESVDVVISFETIEHHDKHEEMILEIKRILKPDGVLIISSPNRLTFSDIPNSHNPFHVKELYYEEFSKLLNTHFQYVAFYGQKVVINSLVLSLDTEIKENIKINYLGNDSYNTRNPMYFIAICSNFSLEIISRDMSSLFYDPNEDMIDVYYTMQITLQSYQQLKSELEGIKQSKFWKLRNIFFLLKKNIYNRLNLFTKHNEIY